MTAVSAPNGNQRLPASPTDTPAGKGMSTLSVEGPAATLQVPTAQADGSVVWGAGGAVGTLDVTDGVTSVTPTTEIDFTSGATVTNAGGGVAQVAIGGSIPNSWLLLESNGGVTTSQAIPVVEADHAGTDITLDVDGITVHIATPGAYVVMAQTKITGDATGAGTAAVQITGSWAAWNSSANIFKVLTEVVSPNFTAVLALTLPPFAVTTPVVVQFEAAITTAAGTIRVGDTNNGIDNYLVQRIF